jgi:hypothetical protein
MHCDDALPRHKAQCTKVALANSVHALQAACGHMLVQYLFVPYEWHAIDCIPERSLPEKQCSGNLVAFFPQYMIELQAMHSISGFTVHHAEIHRSTLSNLITTARQLATQVWGFDWPMGIRVGMLDCSAGATFPVADSLAGASEERPAHFKIG